MGRFQVIGVVQQVQGHAAIGICGDYGEAGVVQSEAPHVGSRQVQEVGYERAQGASVTCYQYVLVACVGVS